MPPAQSHRLLPGAWHATAERTIIETILGSCVAACLVDRVAGIAGMNHFMLPGDGSTNGGEGSFENARYGIHSMELLICDLQQLGASRSRLEAKLFGGGSVLDSVARIRVGERNVEFAFDYLRREGIPVLASDVLGSQARKLKFDTGANKVHLKYVAAVSADVVERELASRKPPAATGGTAELF